MNSSGGDLREIIIGVYSLFVDVVLQRRLTSGAALQLQLIYYVSPWASTHFLMRNTFMRIRTRPILIYTSVTRSFHGERTVCSSTSTTRVTRKVDVFFVCLHHQPCGVL